MKKFKDLTREEKLEQIAPKAKKFTTAETGEKLTAEKIKNNLIQNLNQRLYMSVEEGADPQGVLSFKQQIEDIAYLNKMPVTYYEQFLPEETISVEK